MTALKIVAVDDEPLALRRLQIALAQISGVELVGAARSRDEAARLIATRNPDILLLDIKLRDATGFDVVDDLPDKASPAVIFVTAFDDFATRAFDASAIDYVLKPVAFDRLARAIDRARARLAARDVGAQLAELRGVVQTLREAGNDPPPPRYEAEFWVRRNATDFVRVPVDDIDWISADDDYVSLHVGDRCHLLRETIRGIEKRLNPAKFVRVHRSTLVRVAAIREVRRLGIGAQEVVLPDEQRLRVGRVYAKQFRARLKS